MLAALFGAGNEMDAFIVAFRIPNLVRDLFAEGAMSAAFVPTFTRHLTLRGKDDAWRLGNNVLNALLMVTGALVVAGIVFAAPLVGAYARFRTGARQARTHRAAHASSCHFFPCWPFAATMGMLNSLHYTFVPALSPAMIISPRSCGVALVPLMPSARAAADHRGAIAALVGGVGQVTIQWPPLRSEGSAIGRCSIPAPARGRCSSDRAGTIGRATRVVSSSTRCSQPARARGGVVADFRVV
jgi:putative peptidoglycan lipid II flippase